MLVAVQLDHGIEALLERVGVGGEADHGEDQGCVALCRVAAADLEDFGLVAGVDVVAGRGAGVTSEDGEVVACDGEGGTTVVGVSVGGMSV